MSSSSRLIANSVPLAWIRSMAYASQNVFRLVSSSVAVRGGGMMLGNDLHDGTSGTCGSQMFNRRGAQ